MRSLIVLTSIFSHSLTAASTSTCQAKFHHSNFKTASLPAIATLDRTLLLLLLIVTSCYSLLDWNQTKGREVGPARRETATFCWSGLWIDPMPRLHRIIDALLHAQSCEGEEKETIDADGRLDHSLAAFDAMARLDHDRPVLLAGSNDVVLRLRGNI